MATEELTIYTQRPLFYQKNVNSLSTLSQIFTHEKNQEFRALKAHRQDSTDSSSPSVEQKKADPVPLLWRRHCVRTLIHRVKNACACAAQVAPCAVESTRVSSRALFSSRPLKALLVKVSLGPLKMVVANWLKSLIKKKKTILPSEKKPWI